MAEKQPRMSTNDVGNATGSSLRALRALGASDVHGVSPKINLDEFEQKLIELQEDIKNAKCPVGKLINSLTPELQTKFEIVLKNEKVPSGKIADMLHSMSFNTSKDTITRHRRAMLGQSGCKCYRES